MRRDVNRVWLVPAVLVALGCDRHLLQTASNASLGDSGETPGGARDAATRRDATALTPLDGGFDASPGFDASLPPLPGRGAIDCKPLPTADTNLPPQVVGDGTPQSCTEQALQAATRGDAYVTFNCGAAPVTLALTQPVVVDMGQRVILEGGGRVTFDGQGSSQLLVATDAALVSIRGLTLRNGFAPTQDGCCSRGGAVRVYGGQLELLGSRFEDNETELQTDEQGGGGAVFVAAATRVLVSDSEFSRNRGGNGGGLTVARSPVQVLNSLFSQNSSGQDGGGLRVRNSGAAVPAGVALCGTRIIENTAVGQGGGAHITGDLVTRVLVQDTLFEGNRVNGPLGASGLGGGARIAEAPLLVERTSFISNIVNGFGGGLHVNGTEPDLDRAAFILNSTFYDNQAGDAVVEGAGGGLRVSSAVLSHLTIAQNRAKRSAGVLLYGPVTMTGSLLADNTAALTSACRDGVFKDNLLWPSGTGSSQGPCLLSSSDRAPALGMLQRPPSGTPFLPLGASSPAANRVQDCPEVDQRLAPRPMPCAIGAVEP